VVLGEGADLFVLAIPAMLAGKSLAESEIGARSGLHVIAIRKAGEALTNPAATALLPEGGELIVIGTSEQRMQFARLFPAGKR
jgi:K+/H+ antiporter YhaU regulatory subunit KhtT